MEHSAKYAKVRSYYQSGLWTEDKVMDAVDKWITQEDANEIIGESKEQK